MDHPLHAERPRTKDHCKDDEVGSKRSLSQHSTITPVGLFACIQNEIFFAFDSLCLEISVVKMFFRSASSALSTFWLLTAATTAQAQEQGACPLPLKTPHQTLLSEATFQLHYNGDPEACGSVAPLQLSGYMSNMLDEMKLCDDAANSLANKYSFETMLTNSFHYAFDNQGDGTICASEDDEDKQNDGFFGYCDMGPDRTPPQPDRNHLVPTVQETLPCRFYTREGVRIASLTQLVELLQNKKFGKSIYWARVVCQGFQNAQR